MDQQVSQTNQAEHATTQTLQTNIIPSVSSGLMEYK
jgi:hypothetical protein